MSLSALHRKLLRDLWRMRGQAIAVALVVAAGVATLVMLSATVGMLGQSRDAFFAEQRLADVFVELERAPRSVLARLAEISGVERVEGRIRAVAKLEIEGFREPVSAEVLSLPADGTGRLNRLRVMSGRAPGSERSDEAIVSVPFARAHGFRPGAHLGMILNGRRQRLTITGLGVAPEYVIQVSPGSLVPDPRRHGVLWMPERALADAYDMNGAFNSAALALGHDAPVPRVIAAVDRVLRPYGGGGAYPRTEQLSYQAVTDEIRALRVVGGVFMVVFLSVTAFLLNVVISRVVHGQREQIALLKAFGYSNLAVGLHYGELIAGVVLVGALIGAPPGWWLTGQLAGLYARFYHFPELLGGMPLAETLAATGLMLAAGLLGALRAIRAAVRLPPAEAMRPEAPRLYRRSLVERLGLQRWMGQPTRMVARHIERAPLRSGVTLLGVALATGTMLLTSFMGDSFFHVVQERFERAQHQDLSVSLIDERGRSVLHALAATPGVLYAEGIRQVPVRLLGPGGSERTVIQARDPDARLSRLIDRDGREVPLPPRGIVLTDFLATRLGVSVGDRVALEPLQRALPVRTVPVVATVGEYLGMSGYMSLEAINRLLGDGPVVTGAVLRIDRSLADDVLAALRDSPVVTGVGDRLLEIENFYSERAATLLFTTFITGLLAGAIALGVVYNSATITLMERGRELASLRVLGFTRHEVAYILLGELAVLVLLAIPVGMLVGFGLCHVLAAAMWDQNYRLPVVVLADTYTLAAAVILGTAVVSGLLVRRRLGRLDLIAVLKTRE
ncbi:ABC transporter permease [Spiribacter halobius]|uniref:ABC transporter permease n=1 Tax=Sediminicurvatus halobius TaxID=2182432 RepID=A0A2U2MY05_9GAMM|nr:ABC transporter permease [Spiribacter halobius]PWG61905.1 ABC transporter permease [Spiribacter halobius]UEX79220.1 ABC transporter permease [Spiribacter halobius]